MRATFYGASKRVNSFENPESVYTKRTVFENVHFKDSDVSTTDPLLFIESTNLPETSYCVIDNYGATDAPQKLYYFVKEVTQYARNRWYIQLHKDSLLTYKDTILAQQAFVERSTIGFNPKLIDDMLPQETECDRRITIGNNEIGTNNTQAGIFCLGVLGKGSGKGMVRYYLMNWVEISNFTDAIYDPTFIQSIRQDFNDITSCLISLTYLPFHDAFSMFNVPSQNADIYLGGYRVPGVSGRPLSEFCGHRTSIITIPRKWQDYRQTSNCTIELYLPMYGMVNISPFEIFGQAIDAPEDGYITADYIVDAPTGGGTISLRSDGCVISTLTGQLGASMPVTAFKNGAESALISFVGSISSFGLAVAATAISGPGAMALGAAAGGVASGLQSVRQAFQMSATSVGGMAGMSGTGMEMDMKAFTRYFDTSDQPTNIAALVGRPTHKILTLSALTGYVKTKGFRCRNSGYMTMAEQKEVEDMFNTIGVYI